MNRIVIDPKYLGRSMPNSLTEPLLRSLAYIAGNTDSPPPENPDGRILTRWLKKVGEKQTRKVEHLQTKINTEPFSTTLLISLRSQAAARTPLAPGYRWGDESLFP